jgi:hypothetical protein
MNQHVNYVKRGLVCAGLILAALSTIGLLSISSLASAISQGFFASEDLASGTLVSLKESGTETIVVPADSENNNIAGVVVNKDDSTVALSDGDNQVQVTTNGIANLHVTDLYGEIKVGDPIGVSPIRGVGAKAISNGKIVGVAQTNFDSEQADRTVSVQKANGESEEAKVGSVLIAVQIGYYAVSAEEGQKATGLQQLGSSLAGRPVSTVKVLVSLIIAVTGTVAAAVILYAGVKSGFTAVGRNPLARLSIFKGLKRISIFSLSIFIIALLVGYAILRI